MAYRLIHLIKILGIFWTVLETSVKAVIYKMSDIGLGQLLVLSYWLNLTKMPSLEKRCKTLFIGPSPLKHLGIFCKLSLTRFKNGCPLTILKHKRFGKKYQEWMQALWLWKYWKKPKKHYCCKILCELHSEENKNNPVSCLIVSCALIFCTTFPSMKLILRMSFQSHIKQGCVDLHWRISSLIWGSAFRWVIP